jgi:Amt family ammonium transporter
VGYAEGQTMGGQFMVQVEAVVTTLIWSGVGSFILYKIADAVFGMRVDADSEREGLDITSHGEVAYHY